MPVFTDANVEIVVDESYIRTTGGGGIKISVGGNRLNQYLSESSGEWEDWGPEFEGYFLSSDLFELIKTTVSIIGEERLYHTESVTFTGTVSKLLLETLGNSTIRLAFRASTETDTDSYTARAVPASACGYPVDAAAWGDAVLEAGEAFQDNLEELGHESHSDQFDSPLDELRQQIR